MSAIATVNEIYQMSYPDFVGFLGQKNTPPGGEFTIKKWIELASIDQSSHLLDLACSTGYSSREISKIKGCKGKGIDISEKSIQMADQEASLSHLENKLSYYTADATNLPFRGEEFTHILAGCNFAFILEREKGLEESFRVLKKQGKLCAANFYYTATPPDELLDQIEQSIGFRPSPFWTHQWWDTFFNKKLKNVAEENYDLPVLAPNELVIQIEKAIQNSPYLKAQSEEIRQACLEKLYNIRKVLNEHRKYQKFNITIWEK